MPWETSHRSKRLPPGWRKLRAEILDRDRHRCVKCGSNDRLAVDHILRGDNHHPTNLQTLCKSCHDLKTARESAAARVAKTGTIQRPPELHPGLVGNRTSARTGLRVHEVDRDDRHPGLKP